MKIKKIIVLGVLVGAITLGGTGCGMIGKGYIDEKCHRTLAALVV